MSEWLEIGAHPNRVVYKPDDPNMLLICETEDGWKLVDTLNSIDEMVSGLHPTLEAAQVAYLVIVSI